MAEPLLRRTFCQLPGIGLETERRLWSEGILDWQDLLDNLAAAPIGSADRDIVEPALEGLLEAHSEGKWGLMQTYLKQQFAWRAFSELESRTMYLDIETDGGNRGTDITVIGLYDGSEFRALVKGIDIDDFLFSLEHTAMLVTFFGDGFDIPMLKKRFPPSLFDKVHLDLCPTLRTLGYKGGLKKIEIALGLERGENTNGLSGYDAVKLWSRYVRTHDDDALNVLIEYNREDVVNLQHLARFAVERLTEHTVSGTPLPVESAVAGSAQPSVKS